jgi:FMN-dependent oxidoreductase (nitrilotriacetate monooxygenase family)
MTKNKQMHLLLQLSGGQGMEPGGWRWPGEDQTGFMNVEVYLKAAQLAEKAKLDGLFIVDFPGVSVDIDRTPPISSLDPVVIMALVARATTHIGLATTMSTSLHEPYNIARTLRTLDVLSNGRIGWNVVTTGAPMALLNYFDGLPSSPQKHARSLEVWEAVLRLWGSWPADALKLDVAAGRFADGRQIQPIHYKGDYVATRGPLTLPPSAQGMPVIFTAGGGANGFEFAATKADAMYNNPFSLDYAVNFWKALSARLVQAGRNPDQFTVFSGISVSIAATEKEVMQRRMALDELGNLPGQVSRLGQAFNLSLAGVNRDAPLPAAVLRRAFVHPADERAKQAYDLAAQGATIREVIAHGVLNDNKALIGTPEGIADTLQQWFEAGVGNGFVILGDSGLGSLTDFVEQVVPILQQRGLLRTEYSGSTFRDHLGLPYRNGFGASEPHSSLTAN